VRDLGEQSHPSALGYELVIRDQPGPVQRQPRPAVTDVASAIMVPAVNLGKQSQYVKKVRVNVDTSTHSPLASLRSRLGAQKAARRAYRELRAELATYNRPGDRLTPTETAPIRAILTEQSISR
jgi:hypothetical protein